MKDCFILALDGGGMRGIIPSYILSSLGRILKEKGDTRPLYSHFDLIAGTSTGALIAGALSIPVEGTGFAREAGDDTPLYEEKTRKRLFFTKRETYLRGYIERSADPETFTSLYEEHGKEIFPEGKTKSLLGALFTDKYEAKPYEAFLKNLYGERKMGELMAPTAFVAYSTRDGIVFPITSWDNCDAYIWESARSSSAAPLYFPPYRFYGKSLIDGGIAANNPSLIAYALASSLYPDAEKYHILSLSTAEIIFQYEPSESSGGLTGWASPLTRIFRDASLGTADFALTCLKDVEYTRIWIPESGRRIKLDETGKDTMKTLLDTAKRLEEAKHAELESYAERIAAERTHPCIKLRGVQDSLQ